MGLKTSLSQGLALTALITSLGLTSHVKAETPPAYQQRLPQDEVIYFVLTDRFYNADPSNDLGGLKGDKYVTGFDATDPGFFHGGDIKGLKEKLDYIQHLGITEIWLAPVFKNKAVQGAKGHASAGYHGYWITDFSDIDPHLGTKSDFKAFVDAAHARGMKVIMDIVINHTADVIQYKECIHQACPYRSKADYPDTAYTPFVPEDEAHVKKPDWLNEVKYYHNRGASTFEGESALDGDFGGLDDVKTEDPFVVKGFIDIYSQWIDNYKIDGYRIDTARHVNPEFWQAFIPAILERAKANGIPNFHIFGEVYDPDSAILAVHTQVDRLPAVLDFGLFNTISETLAKDAPTEAFTRLFRKDVLFTDPFKLATFNDNHDAGRIAYLIKKERPTISDDELYQRVKLAYNMVLFSRGTPVIYYGDEQGFVGTGDDRHARQDMMASSVAEYNSDQVLKGVGTGDHFNEGSIPYLDVKQMIGVRQSDRDLQRGQSISLSQTHSGPGAYIMWRQITGEANGTLVAFNTSTKPVSLNVYVGQDIKQWASLYGQCAPTGPTAKTCFNCQAGFKSCGVRVLPHAPPMPLCRP